MKTAIKTGLSIAPKLLLATSIILSAAINAAPQTGHLFEIGVVGLPDLLALQPDGKLLVGGRFTSVGGQPHTNLARLNVDGTLDDSFKPALDYVSSIHVQPDGRILLVGDFPIALGVPKVRLARLLSNGDFDLSFKSPTNLNIHAVAIQPDSRILVGVAAFEGGPVIERFNPDGSLDPEFKCPVTNEMVYALGIQPDGKILRFGRFIRGSWDGVVGRMHPDGSPDTTFLASTVHNGNVYGLAPQSTGSILFGGSFWSIGNLQRPWFARIKSDGMPDPGFDPRAETTTEIVPQTDGRILALSDFSVTGGHTGYGTWRIRADGSLDLDFTSLEPASALALSKVGKPVLASMSNDGIGWVRGFPAQDPAYETLVFENTRARWLRMGTCPEIWYATLEASTNLVDWVPLGQGTRVSGGWEFDVAVPPGTHVRTRGYVSAPSQFSCSSWFVETIGASGQPLILAQPVAQTNQLTLSVRFAASVSGQGPMEFQWRKDENLLPGETSQLLVIPIVKETDAGRYSVIVKNAIGTQTSEGALLVISSGPRITNQPLSRRYVLGQTATLTAEAAGVEPLAWQWQLNGTNLPGAVGKVLTIPSLQPENTGSYRVLVSNQGGSVQSVDAIIQLGSLPALQSWNDNQLYVAAEFTPWIAIQRSTDMLNWTDILTRGIGVYAQVSFSYSDPDAGNYPVRFYRVRQE